MWEFKTQVVCKASQKKMKSRKARTLVTSIEFKLLNTNMYTIIVGDFFRVAIFSYFAKKIENVFGKCVFQCKMCFFTKKS
jgi:hypothetical protein